MRARRRPPAGVGAGPSMRAIVQDRYGAAEVLRLSHLPSPQVADDEVLVRVHAAGVDRGVWHLMTGRPYLLRLVFGLRGPRNPVLGGDLAGTVVAIGSAVIRFAVGDEVYGFGRGSFAEYAVAREDKLARKPDNLSYEQAAAVPVSAATALQALDIGRVRPGQKVLVTGASGGVGSYAVQLAKASGAEVTGVASTAKLDLILDVGGNPTVARVRRALTATGTAVMLTHLIEDGSVAPRIDTTYPLDRASEDIRRLEDGRARGKYVLTT